jgi:valyl-tRNA synthetase
LWHAVYDGNPPAKAIALTKYPQSNDSVLDPLALEQMALLQSLTIEVRTLRKEIGVEEKATVPIEVRIDPANKLVVQQNSATIERLARVSEMFFAEISPGLPKHSTSNFDVAVVYQRTIDVSAERERLTRDTAKYEKGLAAAERQLGNEGFLAKAPAHVVEGLKKQEAETRVLLEKARAALDALPQHGGSSRTSAAYRRNLPAQS